MAEFYKDDPSNRIASIPKKTTTRYTALGQRQPLPPEQRYAGSYSRGELDKYGIDASKRAIASVTVTETHPWESEIKPSYDWYPSDEKTGQLSMLAHQPGQTNVGALVSDPSMRAAVPTLLAMATRGKQNLTHDVQISQHSSRLIGKVRDKVDITSPEKNPTSTANYTSDKNLPWVATYLEKDGEVEGADLLHTDTRLERVPDLEVKVAKDTVRSALRGRRLSPQFDAHVGEQLKFEGTD